MKQESEKERYTPMGQKAESEDSQVDMDEIRRRLDAEDKVIEYLAGEIAKERKKPAAQQDQSRIEKCLDTIAKLKNHKIEYSQEELKAKANALLSKAHTKEESGKNTAHAPTHRYRLRPALVVVILLVVVCLLGTTACGVIPSLKNWFLKLIDMPAGTEIHDGKITYTYNGKITKYDSIEELCEQEGLSIVYPSGLPEDMQISEIKKVNIDNAEKIFLSFSASKVQFVVVTNYFGTLETNESWQPYPNEVFSTFYRYDSVLQQHIIAFIDNHNYYSISSNNLESLKCLLEHITLERK